MLGGFSCKVPLEVPWIEPGPPVCTQHVLSPLSSFQPQVVLITTELFLRLCLRPTPLQRIVVPVSSSEGVFFTFVTPENLSFGEKEKEHRIASFIYLITGV